MGYGDASFDRLNQSSRRGLQRGLEPSLYDRDLAKMRLSTKFPSKQTCRTMQTLKDEEFMFGFKLSCVQISREVFHALF